MKFNPKHINEAIQAGIELIGEGKDANSKLYLIKECGHEQVLYIQSVRNKKFKCSICLQNKLKKEAEEQNLEFIEVDNKAGVGIYKFKECGHTQKIRYSAVRNGEFRCSTCNEMQYHIEAKNADLELIGIGRNTSTRLYKFNKCGHEQIITMTAVRNFEFMCRQCQLEKLNNEAELVGLTLISKVKNPNNRLYKFKKCGHEQEIQIPDIRINKFKCKTCKEIQYKEEAEKADLEIIGESKKNGFKMYRFKSCGHVQEIRMDGVRNENSKVRCNQCQEDKYRKEADEVGLILIGEGRPDYKNYKFKECGHTQEIQPGDVRLKRFKCRTCAKIKYETEVNEAGLELLDEGDTFSVRLYKIKSCGHKQRINIESVRNKSFRCETCFEEKIKREAE